MKNLIKGWVGEANLGRWDYYFKPSLKNSLGGPFNGQTYRRAIFEEMLKGIGFDVIIETGAFRGTTTEFFAATQLPIYVVEINPRFHSYTAARVCSKYPKVQLFLDNSPSLLRKLTLDATFSPAKPFCYLDAHWYDHLPLAEELEIIFGKWHDAVVMVDDFQVPGTNYTYDDYGPGKALTLDYLKPLSHLQLAAFFPTASSEQETGRKRGCVVLGQSEKTIKALQTVRGLRQNLAGSQ